MSSDFEIDGKKLHTIKTASEQTSYSRDYITRLAREEKIVASQIDRQWYIDIESLKAYQVDAALEQKTRQQQLSEERKRERQAHAPDVSFGKMDIQKGKSTSHVRRTVVAVAALSILVGSVLHSSPYFREGIQVAAVFTDQFQNTLLSTSTSILASSPVDSEINFEPTTVRVTELSHLKNGVLLLPAASGTTTSEDVSELFSDEAHVVTDETGQSFVVRVDGEGKVIEKVPVMFAPMSNDFDSGS